MLGGEYSCDNWKATWEIEENNWSAELDVNRQSEYKNLYVQMNHKDIELSENGEKSNGTVSGRTFTLEDVEKMFNVEIIVDQISMTACIQKKLKQT